MLNHSADSKNNGFQNNGYDSKTFNGNGFDVETFATNEVGKNIDDKDEIDKDLIDKSEIDKVIFDKNVFDANGLKSSTTLPQGPIRQSQKVFSNFNSSQSFDQLLLERRNLTKDVGEGTHSSKKF